MKRIFLGLVIGLLFLPTVSLSAGVSTNIVVTATGYIVEGPTGFTLTYVNANQIDMTWTPDPTSVATMIRGKYNSAPTGINDGYLVYNGSGSSTSDTSMNFEDTTDNIYYAAFSQNAGGLWGAATNNKIGGPQVTLIAFFLFAFIVSYYGLKSSFMLFKLLAGMSWFAVLIYWFSNPPTGVVKGDPTHVAVAVILVGIGLAIPVWGLGKEIDRSKRSPYGGMSYKSTAWKFGMRDEPRETPMQRRTRAISDYRDTIRRALGNDED